MQEKIIEVLTKYGMLSVSQLSEKLGPLSAVQFQRLVKKIAKMEEKGKIILTEQGKLRLSEKNKHVSGVFHAHEKGYGFVTVEELSSDLFVPKGSTNYAFNGDKVTVEIIKEADFQTQKGSEAVVKMIDERVMTHVVGVFKRYTPQQIERVGLLGYVIPQDKTLKDYTCFIHKEHSLDCVDNTICSVAITDYPNDNHPQSLYGHIVHEIGAKDAPGIDILTILYKLNIPTEFPEKVLEQAQEIPLEVVFDEEDRKDLRHEQIITIDGADAKDLDDAISLNVLENGHYQLGVHIADVSHYVTEHSPLDMEALERGTSVYLADRVVPMLPQRLSNGICSLHPHEDRLTVTCLMEIDFSGNVIKYELFKSIINSKMRMVYDEVNDVLANEMQTTFEDYIPFLPMLKLMEKLHYMLHRKRQSRGAIDFDTKEAKIEMDAEGKPTAIILRERGVAERMIESFMLLANETVAHHFMQKKLPFIYRIHEQPSAEKIKRFAEFVTHFGVLLKGNVETLSAKQLQKVLKQIAGEPYEAVISTVLLRSMQQAKYDSQPIGHFGLATDDYTHFTSPIRRYPDLLVHRLLKYYLTHKVNEQQKENMLIKIDDIANKSSVLERRAVEAEREVESLKKVEFMQDKIGQTFEGVISSVTRFGLFVELANTVEGLVHVSQMKDDHYVFIENRLALIGERTQKVYEIGQKIKIKVAAVSLETTTIDFEIVYDKNETKQMNEFEQLKQKNKKMKHRRQRKTKQKHEFKRGVKKVVKRKA